MKRFILTLALLAVVVTGRGMSEYFCVGCEGKIPWGHHLCPACREALAVGRRMPEIKAAMASLIEDAEEMVEYLEESWGWKYGAGWKATIQTAREALEKAVKK